MLHNPRMGSERVGWNGLHVHCSGVFLFVSPGNFDQLLKGSVNYGEKRGPIMYEKDCRPGGYDEIFGHQAGFILTVAC